MEPQIQPQEIEIDVPDPEWCEKCGHYHLERTSECPDRNEPCGDYRCCVN